MKRIRKSSGLSKVGKVEKPNDSSENKGEKKNPVGRSDAESTRERRIFKELVDAEETGDCVRDITHQDRTRF